MTSWFSFHQGLSSRLGSLLISGDLRRRFHLVGWLDCIGRCSSPCIAIIATFCLSPPLRIDGTNILVQTLSSPWKCWTQSRVVVGPKGSFIVVIVKAPWSICAVPYANMLTDHHHAIGDMTDRGIIIEDIQASSNTCVLSCFRIQGEAIVHWHALSIFGSDERGSIVRINKFSCHAVMSNVGHSQIEVIFFPSQPS